MLNLATNQNFIEAKYIFIRIMEGKVKYKDPWNEIDCTR